jgi:hypothetical protein
MELWYDHNAIITSAQELSFSFQYNLITVSHSGGRDRSISRKLKIAIV